jgi:CHAT domain-containing protein
MFADFHLVIAAGTGDGATNKFPTSAMSSFGGRANSSFVFDENAEPMATDLVLASGNDSAPGLRENVGKRLFGMIHTADVLNLWLETKARAEAEELGVRFRLSVDEPVLSVIPWELLHDGSSFVATGSDTPFSRYLPVGIAPYLSPPDVLRMLVIVQDPGGKFTITSREIQLLEQALGELRPSLVFKILQNASIATIQGELQTDYHIVHYLGHGDSSRLFFTSEQKMFAIDDAAFAQLFSGRRSLRLIVLNACSSADSGGVGLFSGVGPALVAKRIPAVVAMQYRFVRLETASQFSKALYRSIAKGLPVDVAVNEARQLISVGPLLGTREWSTPVLYMSTPVGRIVDIASNSDATASAWSTIKRRGVESARVGAAIGEVSQTVREFVAYQHEVLGRDVRAGFELLSQVRTVASLFGESGVRISRLGNGTGQEVLQLLPAFRVDWTLVEENALPGLRAYLAAHTDHRFYPEGMAILSRASAVQDALQKIALVDLLAGCREFWKLIVDVESVLLKEIDGGLTDLMAASERTLGKLT